MPVETPSGTRVAVVLRDRLAYLALDPADPTFVDLRLQIYDTSDPADLALAPDGDVALDNTGSRIKSVFGSFGNSVGGTITLNVRDSCNTTQQCTYLQNVRVQAAGSSVATISMPLFELPPSGIVSAGYNSADDLNLVIYPSLAPNPIRAARYDTNSHQLTGAIINAPSTLSALVMRGFAFDPCNRVAFTSTPTGDTGLFAFPMEPGTPAHLALSDAGQDVAFEPHTRTVLAPFASGADYEIRAFTLGGTATAPALTRRSATTWRPPIDLRPILVATTTPAATQCL